MMNAQSRSTCFGAVRRTNASFGCSNIRTAQFHFLQSIDNLVEVKDQMSSIADFKSTLGVNALCLQVIEFFKQTRNMHNHAVANNSNALWID